MDDIEAFETHHGRDLPERKLETLADALQLLVARDDEIPARWLSPAFGREVATIRTLVASVATKTHLAARLEPDAEAGTDVEAGRFERACRRLAADAPAVALAIRWLEIQDDHRLPTWPEILRRRRILPVPVPSATSEAASWFG